MRPSKRPPEFDFLNILADHVTVGLRQLENPFANRLTPYRVHIESRGQFFSAINHSM
jgi:hypothetical protein